MQANTTDGVVIPELDAPLWVDLEGTLIANDLLWESMLALIRARPFELVLLPVWLWKGRTHLRLQVMQRAALDGASLPYRQEVITFLKEQKQQGRRLVLTTAVREAFARQVADHLGLFDEVLDSGAVTRSSLECPRGGIEDLVQALRPHQWAKNLLLFVPLLTSHQLRNLGLVLDALLAFVAFCLTASAVYVLNDLLDLPSDRRHHTKHRRPFASGRLSIPTGFGLVLVLMAAGLCLALLLPPAFVLLLMLYMFLTTAYSTYLKRKLLLDVICLAGLYTQRILAGGAATNTAISPWLMAFSMFFFLSLAFAKRYTELAANRETPLQISGRGYLPGDLELVRSTGPVCGQLSVLILCLYINSPDVRPLYRTPEALWLLCPIFFYWISRIWFLACRQQLTDDPVLFAIKDRTSYVAGALVIAVLAAAT